MALPLSLDLRDRHVVAVGGGSVTERRVRAFLAEGARVVVIAPAATDALAELAAAGAITWHRRRYAGPDDLASAHLVHTATGDPLLDTRVARDADAHRSWCINASDGAGTAASMSARVTLDLVDGPVTVAVNASLDPRRAVRIRDALADHLRSGAVPLHRVRPAH